MKEIEPELKNIKQLKQVIEDYTKGKDNSIKIVMLREFAKDLDTILNKYETNIFKKTKDEEF